MKPPSTEPSQVSALENWTVGLILVVFVVVAFNAIHNGAMAGQDFPIHMANLGRQLFHPDIWFSENMTYRPLLYWVGGFCSRFSHNLYTYQLAAMIFTLAGTAALWLLHDSLRRVISSRLLRVSGLMLVAFLPATVITTLVYAADTVALLPFVLAGWSAMRSLEDRSEGRAAAFAALAGLAFSVGNFSKATFLTLPVALVFVLLALWRAGRVTARRGWTVFALGVAFPALVGGWVWTTCAREVAGQPDQHSFNWKGTGEMTLRSLVGLKASDARIFNAPEYFTTEVRDGVTMFPLLLENSYSYPALLHLAVFTDVMNLADARASLPRPEPQKAASRWTVRVGIVFSLGAVVAVLAFWTQTAWAFVRPARMPSAAGLVWSSMAMAWFMPIAGVLPFVNHSYIMGYWLPRLVLPAVWIFLLSAFVAADHVAARWRKPFSIVVALLVLAVSALGIRSVWYKGRLEPTDLRPPSPDAKAGP